MCCFLRSENSQLPDKHINTEKYKIKADKKKSSKTTNKSVMLLLANMKIAHVWTHDVNKAVISTFWLLLNKK